MRIYNNYILIVACLFLLTTVILVALGQNSLPLYYFLYVIEALVVTELYVYFNAEARRRLRLVSGILFGGFLFIISIQVIRILV